MRRKQGARHVGELYWPERKEDLDRGEAYKGERKISAVKIEPEKYQFV